MKTLRTVCLAAAFLGSSAATQASPTIELKDGSRIEGDIQSVDNGTYTVHSASLGTVRIAQSNIARIVYDGDASSGAGSSSRAPARDENLAREMQQVQARLAQDPGVMRSIMSLQSDPQIQAVLADPAIAKAIQEGDYTSLLGNPKIQALESNDHLKQLLQQAQ